MSAQQESNTTQQIVGVITPLGPFGLHTRHEGWMLGFHVNPWRTLDGPMHFTELRVTKPMPEAQIDGAKAAFPATSVVSFSIQELEPTDRGTHRAKLEAQNSSVILDPEMAAAATELRLPVQVTTSSFGTLHLDRRIDLFEGEIGYSGRRVGLSIPAMPGSGKMDDLALAVANQLWANLQTLDVKARGFAAGHLVDLKNENWLEEDEDEMPAVEFQRRISLTAFTVEARGRISLYYDDGGIFFGHSINVYGNVSGEFLDASISG